MQVRLDDAVCELDVDSISQVLAQAADLAEQRGRIIVDIEADGHRWGDEEIASADEQPVPATLALTTAEPHAIACQTLTDAGAALVVADDLQREAAEMIEADKITEAMANLSQAFSIWTDVERAVSMSIQVVGLNIDEMTVNDTPVMETISRLGQRLQMVIEALQSRDPVGLADTLLYELPEIVQEWRDLLDELKTRIASGAA